MNESVRHATTIWKTGRSMEFTWQIHLGDTTTDVLARIRTLITTTLRSKHFPDDDLREHVQ